MTEERYNKLFKVVQQRQFTITLLLENVFDPHNISAVMRTADAVGIQNVYVLNNMIPPHKKWGNKSSSSAAKWMTVHQYTNTNECVEALKKEGFALWATHLGHNAVSLHQVDFTQKIALVFGNEGKGITNELLQACQSNFIIPQMGIIQSLNISVACAVTIYEAMRQKQLVGHYNQDISNSTPHQQLLQQWQLNTEDIGDSSPLGY
jgi:tRNA (guanosine-2'-O-)-methyltransferase